MDASATKDFARSDVRDEEVVALVRKYFDVPAQSQIDATNLHVLHRFVWRVSVSDRVTEQEFFIKSTPSGAEKQAHLVNRADAVLANSPGHVASEIYFDHQYGLMVSRGFSGQTIASLM
jgi:hypothetical protein